MYILDILQKNTIYLNEEDINRVHNLFKFELRRHYADLCYKMDLGDLVYSIRNTKLSVGHYSAKGKREFVISGDMLNLILNYLNIYDYNNFRDAVQGRVKANNRLFPFFPALPLCSINTNPLILRGRGTELTRFMDVLPDGRIISGSWDKTIMVW